MKVKFVLVVLALLVALAVPVSAQERVHPRNQRPVGSVSTSQTRNLDPVGPRQVGIGGRAEAQIMVAWYGTLNRNFVGTAISKMIAGNGSMTACAKVQYLRRNGQVFSGSAYPCEVIFLGGQVKIDAIAWADWANATWDVVTEHQFTRNGRVWQPTLHLTVSP